MKTSPIINSIFAILLSFAFLFFSACDTINDALGIDENESGILTTEKDSFKSGEVAMIFADFEIESGNYYGTFEQNEIKISVENNNVFFVVPDAEPSIYELLLNFNNTDYYLVITVIESPEITNPEQYIESIELNNNQLLDYSIMLDSMLLQADMITNEQLTKNKKIIEDRLAQVIELTAQLSDNEKEEFAKIYEANRYWLDEYREIVNSTYKSSQCESLLNEGNNAKAIGHKYEANAYFLKYRHCKIETINGYNLPYYLNKFNALYDDLTSVEKSTEIAPIVPVIMALGVVYLAWDRMVQELENMSKNSIAEEIEEDNKTPEVYNNKQKYNYKKRVRFRSVDFDDNNGNDIFSTFVGLIHKANEAVKRFLSLNSDYEIPLVNLTSSNKTIDFNRNMIIANISNSNVGLSSSSIVGDDWKISFETELTDEQQFTYDLMYNDGKTQITKQYSATLAIGDPLLGEWEAYEVDGYPVGEWQYYYFEDCPDLLAWASVTHMATLTLDGSNIIVYYDGSDKAYNYIGINYDNCTYESLSIEQISDDDSYTSTYTLEGNKIIVQTLDGEPFIMYYQLEDQNSTLIINADGEINKYTRAK